ncbi:MAG TPA: DNA methyltransferase [Vicinamibacterales bacterium]|nr:DNA methyltransferase [Vicinamibacterales bacterium]
MNRLYYGDNLDVLRRYVEDASVDLVYLDPPFNSNANYNVLFAEKSGTRSSAQIQAFEDTWQWDASAAEAYRNVVESGATAGQALIAFRAMLGESNMLAYLAMMAPRLVELRRVLKSTGSIYLHCDPTASHYLKMLLDAIFGPERFLNEIIWKRANAHNDPKRYGRISDSILFYAKGDKYIWNTQHTPYREDYYESHFKKDDEGRWFRTVPLDAPRHGAGSANLLYDWKGKLPAASRTWAVKIETMERYDREGLLRYTRTGTPTLLQYADDMPGVPLQNIWTDIPPVNPQAQERLGYPTQKPETLLSRILSASSDEGHVVLDPFCGCGTTIAAAQKLNRRWIGIDVTHLAIGLIKKRLSDAYGESIKDTYDVIGEPVSLEDAEALAAAEPFQFQTWALGLVGARPAGSEQVKKGKDRGIDGLIHFHDDNSGDTKRIVLSVKAGHTGPDHVRDLRGTVEREKAQIGVLITMQDTTKEMRKEAASGEFYTSQWGVHPKIQILTVADLLSGKGINRPPDRQTGTTFKKAPKAARKQAERKRLDFDGPP